MAMEYIELGRACDTCVIAIANDDFSCVTEEQEQATRAGLARIGHSLIVGDEYGFLRNARCIVCRDVNGGSRHKVGYLIPLKVSVSRIRLNAGGYDRTGRYWGCDAPLFHVASEGDSINFELRAVDRDAAIAEVSRRYPGALFNRGASLAGRS